MDPANAGHSGQLVKKLWHGADGHRPAFGLSGKKLALFYLDDYDYHLPEKLIAHYPSDKRDQSRLLCLARNTSKISHHRFSDIEAMLSENDVVVVNNTEVIPGRLYGKKETGGKVEVLILDYARGKKNQTRMETLTCEALIRASKRPKDGTRIHFNPDLAARVLGFSDGVYQLQFTCKNDFTKTLYDIGKVPLPPYIKRAVNNNAFDDQKAYQTVYASQKGAVAAPTAGLHFTSDLMTRLKAKGVKVVEITLHVGYGTFLPVRETDIRNHKIHSEWFSISEETAATVSAAKKNNHRVAAVGTTSVRTLEYAAKPDGLLAPISGNCDLYIYPGYEFKCVDAMITNFHLPKSTLLMLVSAFTGRENILAAYEEAIKKEYRFFSYGDAMFIS